MIELYLLSNGSIITDRINCASVAVAALTMIPFSSLTVRTHQHRSLYEAKGNVLIPRTPGYTLTVNKKKRKKEIKRAHRLEQITCYCIRQTMQAYKFLTEKIILTLKVIVATVTLSCYLCVYGQNKNL